MSMSSISENESGSRLGCPTVSNRENNLNSWKQKIGDMTLEESAETLKIMKRALSLKYFKKCVKHSWADFQAVWKAIKTQAVTLENGSPTGKETQAEDGASPFGRLDPSLIVFGQEGYPHPENIVKGEAERFRHKLVLTDVPVSLRRRIIEKKRKIRNDHMMNLCKSLLARVSRHRFGWFFTRPVDDEDIVIPSGQRMRQYASSADLRCVKDLIHMEVFTRPGQVAHDVRCIFSNIQRFYDPSPKKVASSAGRIPSRKTAASMVEEVSNLFETGFLEVQALLDEDDVVREEEEEELYTVPEEDEVDWDDLEKGLVKLDFQLRQASGGEGKKERKQTLKPKWKMAWKEIAEMAHALENLPEVILDYVVEIIRSHQPEVKDKDEVMRMGDLPQQGGVERKTVDIDHLDGETLLALQQFVAGRRRRAEGKKRRQRREVGVDFLTVYLIVPSQLSSLPFPLSHPDC